MTRVTKSNISLEMECWVEDLSEAQLAAYDRVANEHNMVKNALKNALSANEGKELFNGQVFQAYSFKGKVLQEIKEASLPKKPPKPAEPPQSSSGGRGRKRQHNFAYLESSDEEEDDLPLAKRLAISGSKKGGSTPVIQPTKAQKKNAAASVAAASSANGKASPQVTKAASSSAAKGSTKSGGAKTEKAGSSTAVTSTTVRPCEINSVGGLVVASGDNKDGKTKDGKEPGKELKMQGKTYPSLVVLAKPHLKIKDMTATRSKLDSKVKLVLMLTPNKFCEWLIQEGLLRSAQTCVNHRNNELKLGVYSDAAKFPYTGGYVWISECCPLRFVSVFHNSIFEGAQHPPSCILKLIYHWACQTSIQNVVQWVKVDSVYIKGIYTWLRAICTLAVHQKLKKIGGPEKFVEVGVISLGTTSQDGNQRQVKVEVLGVYDYADKSIRLRAVEPVIDEDRNYKKRFQMILEPLQRWVTKDSIICIDLTVDKMTLYSMGFKNIVQAAPTDINARHNNSYVMEYLRRIVPRMFQNTLSLLSRQMIQQFLDELVWRECFGTYALQAFNNITSHISEQTRVIANETLTQRLYQVATNPFKDWSILPPNYKETPANNTPKRLKKPINDADYINLGKETKANIKKEHIQPDPPTPIGKRRAAVAAAAALDVADEFHRPEKKSSVSATKTSGSTKHVGPVSSKQHAPAKSSQQTKHTPVAKTASKKPVVETKQQVATIKKEEDDLNGLEEMYYGVCDGHDGFFENFPYIRRGSHQRTNTDESTLAKSVTCPICYSDDVFDSNEKLQTHLVSHINPGGKEHQFQCLFCLEKHQSEDVLAKHNQLMHPLETKANGSSSYHCIICQQRHNSLNHLTIHLQKVHNVLELPYCCNACGYRSSSHRDVVRHFYDDHKNQNFLQCPFCLDLFYFCKKGELKLVMIELFFMHLRKHVGKKSSAINCQKCALNFIDKGSLKQHLAHHHVSMIKSSKKVRILLSNSLLIPNPKVRTHHREQLPYTLQKLPNFSGPIEGLVCVECNSTVVSKDHHYSGFLKCNKCNFKSCCERAMFQHAADCNGTAFLDGMEITLPQEMHCICGFATSNGNKLAQHLAMCGQKSCYPSVEVAHENAVKRNMLDMLGLVRRDGETGDGIEEGAEQQATTSMEDPNEGEQVELQKIVADAMDQQQQYEPVQDQDQVGVAVAVDNAVDVGDVSAALVPPAVDNIQEQQEPIQFGEMEAAPVMLDGGEPQVVGADGVVVTNATAEYEHIVDPQQQPQYTISFGQSEVQGQALTASDIDMPLIGELADPNPPPTPQFLGEVHTPMFDPDAAAEQQHYHQMMHAQQQQQQQQQHHHQQHPQ